MITASRTPNPRTPPPSARSQHTSTVTSMQPMILSTYVDRRYVVATGPGGWAPPMTSTNVKEEKIAMSKAERNRQRAREKIAQARAEEAQRKRRRLWLSVAAAIVVLAAAATGITLA